MTYTDIRYSPYSSSATDGLEEWYIGTEKDGQYIRVRYPHSGYSSCSYKVDTSLENIDKISRAVTKKDRAMIKDEVKKYLKDQMVEDAKEIAGELFDDIEQLKKEKTQLKKDITLLKKQIKKAQEDMREEVHKVEELLEKRAMSMSRFGNLDFSE